MNVLIMCYDCSYIIEKTISSYIGKVDNIWIFIDKKSDKKTIDAIIKYIKYVKCSFINFENFSQARNECLEYVEKRIEKDEWIIFIDDSYILHGNFNELKTVPEKVVNIRVYDAVINYSRNIIFKSGYGIRYKGIIHENIGESSDLVLKNAFIFDYKNEESVKRSLSRVNLLIESNNIHHRTLGYLQLFLTGKITKNEILNKQLCICNQCQNIITEI